MQLRRWRLRQRCQEPPELRWATSVVVSAWHRQAMRIGVRDEMPDVPMRMALTRDGPRTLRSLSAVCPALILHGRARASRARRAKS